MILLQSEGFMMVSARLLCPHLIIDFTTGKVIQQDFLIIYSVTLILVAIV